MFVALKRWRLTCVLLLWLCFLEFQFKLRHWLKHFKTTMVFSLLANFGSRVADTLKLWKNTFRSVSRFTSCYFYIADSFRKCPTAENKSAKNNHKKNPPKNKTWRWFCPWCLITWGCCPNNIYLNLQIYLSLRHSYVRGNLLSASVHLGEGAGCISTLE